jgi:hypothetical protein
VLLLVAGASQWACPAYTFSGLGPSTGHEEIESRPAEEGAVLSCNGAFCDSFTVRRDFDQRRRPGVFLAVLGAEAVASAVLISNAARISRDDKAGLVNPANDSRYTWNRNAAIAACTATVIDGIFGLVGWGGDSFDRIFRDEHLDQRGQVQWRRTKARVELADLKSQDGKDILARFSVKKVFDLNGLKPGQAEAFPVRAGMKLVTLQFETGGVTGLSEAERKRLRLLLYGTVRAALGEHKPAALDLMSDDQRNLILSTIGTLEKAGCGDQCNLETAKQVQADLLVTGVIDSVGGKLKLRLQLDETKDGKILAQALAEGSGEADLDREARRAATDLMEALK